MGTRVASTDMSGALFGKTRRAVLGLLYARPDEAFYLRQITREVQAGHGAVQRELQRLVDAGILTREVRGREIHYRANRACSIFVEVHGLVLTPRRLELLRAIRRDRPASISQLAQLLGRDFKNVHTDVQALARYGLVSLTASRAGRHTTAPRVPFSVLEFRIAV